MTQLNLCSWFLEPVPHNANRWTKVRVWGIPVAGHTRKWWRSSSIHTRHSANHLQTRYGTTVHLHGPISKKYATALRMPHHAIRSFARGFPPKWQQLLAQHSAPVRRSTRIAASESKSPSVQEPRKSRQVKPNDVSVKPARKTRSRSTASRLRGSDSSRDRQKIAKPSRSSRTSKPLKTTKSTTTRSSKTIKPTTTRSSRITKSTPATSSRRNKPAISSEIPPRSTKLTLKPARRPMKPALRTSLSSARMSDPNCPAKKPSRKRVAFADFKQTKPNVPAPSPKSTPAKLPPPLSDNWSEVQKEAFERQRNTVPADNPDYWEEIAIGVEGKTPEDCQRLWESTWVSPAGKKTKRRISLPKSPKISTPEVAMHVRKAATKKRSRNTGKYRAGVRRLADMVARETSDELLEPEIVTPKMSGVVLKDGVGNIPVLGTDGTPGTEVRQKREKVSQDGELATPEILARGKVFGLQEADRYVSLFKRRLGTCVVPKLKSEHGNDKENKHTNVPRSSFIQTTLVPKAEYNSDNESLHSEESDLYF